MKLAQLILAGDTGIDSFLLGRTIHSTERCIPIKHAALRFGALMLAVTTVSLGGPLPASAAPTEDKLSTLLSFNPGSTESEVMDTLLLQAHEEGSTIEAVLDEAYQEVVDAYGPGVNANYSVMSGSIVMDKSLTVAQRKGDVFYSDSNKYVVNHGHTGIYSGTHTITEAPGQGWQSRNTNYKNVAVASGAVMMRVETSQTKRNAAGHYAYHSLKGKNYDSNFWNSRKSNWTDMNCSKLVWAAYWKQNIDIDANKGYGVYPIDIKNSKLTVTYKTIR